MQSYADGLPFYKMDLLGTMIWGVALLVFIILPYKQKKTAATINA
jgi:hypothetical protein